MPENILVTSAGRRGLLVQLFQRELEQLCPAAQVYATDLCPQLSSACQLADRSFRVPPISQSDYLETLLELCRDHEIGMIVPTIDTELLLLAENQEQFSKYGIHVIVSDSSLVRQCRDKRLTAKLFASYGIDSPREVEPAPDSNYPLFAKPYDGSAGRNLQVIHDYSQAQAMLSEDEKQVCYEYMSPLEHDEYTVDMYYDRQSRLRCFVPRLRIETRAGEVSKGRTARIPSFDCLPEKMGQIAGARGCLTVQFFVRRSGGEVFGIEVNPRFGGGFPLSCEAGANFPRWLIQEYLQDKTIGTFEDWENDLTMLRYDHHVLVRSSA